MDEPVRTQVDSEPAAGLTAGPPALATGMAVGRYLVGERLGEGGMGVVYLARDRLLDRPVALKVLKGRGGTGPDPAGQDRLFAEARKLAQLQDPHIVAVYDVGTFADQVYFAMEYMPGSFRGLLAAGPPGPGAGADRLRLVLEAGRGLAAAHRAGIVHRDFKPDNVLLDAAGRARVSDFGLALPVGAGAGREGTPAYLPPGEAPVLASPATDQYAFCVTAWEALTGRLPPAGDGPALTPHLRRVLQRGLAAGPEDRFPSMEPLLKALESDPARTRRARLLVAGGGLAVAASLAVAAVALGRETPREAEVRRCRERVSAERQALWGPARQAEAEAAFARLGPAGAATFTRVRTQVEPEVEAWAARAAAVCAAPEEQPGRRRLEACLGERRLALGTFSQLLAGADAAVAANAVNTASLVLVPVALCDAAGATSPVEDGEADAALRPRLAKAQVLWASGRWDAAQTAAEALAEDAEQARARHVLADALLLEGRVGAALRQPGADEVLERAVIAADGVQADEQRASALVALAGWLVAQGRDVEARRALESAGAVVDRLGRPALLAAEQLTAEGLVETQRAGGSRERARQAFAGALELRRRVLPDAHPLVINALANWATTLAGDERRAWQERVLAHREETFGPAHLQTAAALYNLGGTELELRRCADAKAHLARARAIQELPGSEPLGRGRVLAALARLERRCNQAPGRALELARAAAELLRDGKAPVPELRQVLEELVELLRQAGGGRDEAELRAELERMDEEAPERGTPGR